MEPGANLAEWMELLNEMLQFLDAATATTTAEMCFCSKKAMDGNQQSAGDLRCEQKCDQVPSPGTAQNGTKESAEYMNIVNKIDESRYTLVHKCRALLRKLEASSTPQNVLDEEENSYLEMGGVGHKNDINLTQQPPDKIDSGENSESCCGDKEITPSSSSCAGEVDRNEAELNLEENCYDFTTDRCLYDECGEPKLNNTANVLLPAEDLTTSSSKCPFSGLPAAHLRIKHSPKSGTLFRQEKRIFFDQTKKYYAGLLDRWLLLYNNSNELKPTQCIQVKDIKLDLSLNDQINEKSQFHVITQEDAKICFTSPSFKELNEWVVAIQQNLLAKPDNSPRKLPLPPTPTPYITDEPDTPTGTPTDSSVARIDSEESIYEEPQLLSKQRLEPTSTEQHNNYDTPKLVATSTDNLSQQHLKATPTKIINDALISPKTTTTPCEPTVAPPTSTPVKSWIFNRFNKSPSSGADSENIHSKPTARKPPKKQLSFATADANSVPASNSKSPTSSSSITIVSSSVSANKGSKINMIISQLEANGQLSLLSKSLNDKRNTWCMEE